MASVDRIQGLSGSLAVKVPCRVATTANITLSGLQTIDGVTVVADDRVLVKNQTTASENGIYLASTSAWTRAQDFDGANDVVKGTTVGVTDGGTLAGYFFDVTTSNPVVPGSSSITFASSASAAAAASAAQASASAANVDALAAAASAIAAANSEGAAAASEIAAAASAATALAAAWDWEGQWLTATAYALNDTVYQLGSSYICISAHTSGTFATDLAALKWELIAQKGTDGTGSGDLLAANNLSDVANAGTARANLGLAIGTDVQAYDADTAKYDDVTANFTGNLQKSGANVRTVGVETIWIPAGAMTSRTTNGAGAGTAETSTNKIMLKTLDFDQTTSEFAQFNVTFPKSWNESTVTARFYWSAASGSGTVTWGLQGVALSDDDVLDTAFGSAQTVTDTLIATTDLHVSAATSAITIAGTPADGDQVYFQVYRDIADTLNADARLHGVKLFYTTDAANDA